MSKKTEYLYHLAYIAAGIWMFYAYTIDPHPLANASGRSLRDVIGVVCDGAGPFLMLFTMDMIFEGPIWKEFLKERTENIDKVED